MYKIPVSLVLCFMLLESCHVHSVEIGGQIWKNKNLNVCHYRNLKKIPEAKTKEEWLKYGKEGKGCWCYDSVTYNRRKAYGRIYNWYAVNNKRGLAPLGWRVPYANEWETLFNSCGGETMAGRALKSTKLWRPEPGAPCPGIDSFGFNAIPGGSRDTNGFFTDGNAYATWLTATSNADYPYAANRGLAWDRCNVGKTEDLKSYGYSVRCVKGR